MPNYMGYKYLLGVGACAWRVEQIRSKVTKENLNG